MNLIGALAAGVCAFFAVGLATGRAPQINLRHTENRPEISKRQIWLTQAGLDLSPAQYWIAIAVFGLVVFGLVSALTSTPIVALAPTLGSVIIPHTFFTRKRSKNLAKTKQAWPDAIREIIASIESNASLHGALVLLSYKGPEPLRIAFERFPTIATTSGVVPALEAVRERLADPTSDRVIEVLILAHERGGGIVTDILRDLATATTEDLQLGEEIESAALEQKINSRAVFVIPWMVLILLVMSSQGFKTFYQSTLGFVVVVAAATWSGIGMLIVAKLSQHTSEPRVFGGSALSTQVEANSP